MRRTSWPKVASLWDTGDPLASSPPVCQPPPYPKKLPVPPLLVDTYVPRLVSGARQVDIDEQFPPKIVLAQPRGPAGRGTLAKEHTKGRRIWQPEGEPTYLPYCTNSLVE